MTAPHITPRLVAADADAALAFYEAALGGEVTARFTDPTGRVVHAEVRIGGTTVFVTSEDGEHNVAPTTSGSSSVLLSLAVDDADATGAAMVAAGAEVLIPIDDRPYGAREGRLRDPAGHLWILSQPLEDLTPGEVQRRLGVAT
jgi:PhnB protein